MPHVSKARDRSHRPLTVSSLLRPALIFAAATTLTASVLADPATALPAEAIAAPMGLPLAKPARLPHLDPGLARVVPADAGNPDPTAPAIPVTVDDAFVVRLTAEAALVVRTLELDSDIVTGFTPLDDLALANGVSGLRPLFPGSDPFRDQVRGWPDLSGWFTVTVDLDAIDRDVAMAAFALSPFVAEVQPIGIHPVAAIPNDGNFANQWFLNQTSDKDIDAPEAWDIENGSPSITVAVLDTGVRYYHKDLGGVNASSSNPTATNGNIWRNLAEANGAAGIDDDGNGYIDDWVGFDFVASPISTCWSGEDCTGADNDPRDFNGHGTHCAGLVAAMNNNGYAVASAAGGFGSGTNAASGDGAKVMCLRIGHSASYGGQEVGFVRMDYAASALYYAASNGAKIASCSWGSSNSGGLAAATDAFIASGGLIFKAAGNDNTQTADYLCSRSDVYSVVATDQADKKASFSTYGTWADISAPGVAIYSTYHEHTAPASDYVAALDGTSMATPIVASCAAVVWSANPTWTRSQVWDRLRTTADPIDSLNPSFVGKLGSGRVNVHKALTGTSGGGGGGPGGTGKLLFSFAGTPILGAAGAIANEDIAQYDLATGTWSVYFDGSDVGLASYSIDAFARLANGDLLISTAEAGTLTGLTGGPSGTSFDDSDILRFTPSSVGANTAGTWSFHFDGSDVGLDQSGEDIDALAVLSDGSLVLSTTGSPTVPGLSGLADEDLVRFTPTSTGAATAGTWSYWFDGSDVGLGDANSEETDAAYVTSSGVLSLSTLGAFSVTGVSGGSAEYFDFVFATTGVNTTGSFSAYFVGSSAGVPSSANITGADEIP